MPTHSAASQLPFIHLNLRRNPFGELSLDDWTILACVDVESVVANLSFASAAGVAYAVQFVGEKGYGKTTHLLSIRARFADAGYVHISEGERATLPGGWPVLIDEAQRLTLWQRWQLFRSATPLVLGTHRDFTKELLRSGRTVDTIEVERATDQERLHGLLNARVSYARRTEGAVPTVTRETAEQLLQEFGPNIRAILHKMYVMFQNLSEVGEV